MKISKKSHSSLVGVMNGNEIIKNIKTMTLPNGINLKKLAKLLEYSDRYEISIQFWPNQTAVYISKNGVDLQDYGGDFDFVITQSIAYLDRINKNNHGKHY